MITLALAALTSIGKAAGEAAVIGAAATAVTVTAVTGTAVTAVAPFKWLRPLLSFFSLSGERDRDRERDFLRED